ncbi:MAG: hypothetical protein KGH61_01020 [Candidatus Micrarchaeota archaeon]|nr:hypothetical protein [Candidatus Micrarchaeota archaeon]MDE1847516.1 hypothetical protein [Candidatus Micrarchaeota archaeon]MDE1863848.1 hypothetical protein [Candidatus Micrarchaeota archaeon]
MALVTKPKNRGFPIRLPGSALRENRTRLMKEAVLVLDSGIWNIERIGDALTKLNPDAKNAFSEARKLIGGKGKTDKARTESLKRALNEIKALIGNEQGVALNWNDPTQVRSRLAERASKAVDAAFPNVMEMGIGNRQRKIGNYPEGVDDLVDAAKMLKQFENKDRRQYGLLDSSIIHKFGNKIGAKNATEQLNALLGVEGRVSADTLFDYIAGYGANATLANVLIAAREKGSTGEIREFLGKIDIDNIGLYYPGTRRVTTDGEEGGDAAVMASVKRPPDGGGGAGSQSKPAGKAIDRVFEQAKELESMIERIKDKQDVELINMANHQSLTFAMFAKSVMNVLHGEDRQRIRGMLSGIDGQMQKKAGKIGLKIYYIPKVKYYDLRKQSEEEFIKDWNAYMVDLHESMDNGKFIFLGPDGDRMRIEELEELLKRLTSKTVEGYGIFTSLIRGGSMEVNAPTMGSEDGIAGTAFGV